MDIAFRDRFITDLELELKQKKKNLNTQFKQLKGVSNENRFIESVVKDYIDYFDYIKKIKENQQQSLNDLVEYLDNIMKNSGLTDEAIQNAKKQQKNLLQQLNIIKKDLNEIISQSNINGKSN
jgi:hypothetical protein